MKGNDILQAVEVTRKDVEDARGRIAGSVATTPLIPSSALGRKLWLKCECLQTGGAFKLRGATNRLMQLTAGERERGVVAFSSGNHAQGIAIAARRLGMPAMIVMPADAPAVKAEATRSHGAEIMFYDRRNEDREAIAAELARVRGAVVVPSFADPAIIAGQGTAGLELLDQLGRSPELIVVPAGGGGLASGIALACPDARIICVEPEGWDDLRRSLEGGEIVAVEAGAPDTICDALQTPRISPITYAILKASGATVVTVSDHEVREAVRFAWAEHGLVVEPGGAAALAALLAGTVAVQGETVAILSGGNIDPALHARIVG